MSHQLRPILPADLAVLARLHAQCFPEDAWDQAALAGVLAMPGASGRLVEAAAPEPQGFIFDIVTVDEAEILTLGVAPGERRRGVARALLADLFARARAAGARQVMLEVAADNAPALALYETLGFGTVGSRHAYYQRSRGAAVDAWLLKRTLT